jgi:flavin reductase (DIM6/NTAB) family NADH-FMN oxidoreductase RutF
MSALLGAELNSALKDLFDKRISIVILATVDQDNHPHTAPFNYLVAHGLKHLRVAVSRNHQTYRNIMENGKVALAVLDEGDIAVSIKGTGRLLLENM